ncbi:hypothetical protein BDZ89DRAFT_1159621 [Hymenopellis radicata]|nr:hypothetical protein BDZ89DRAFT_1159621 [Hymenopellis radicata]
MHPATALLQTYLTAASALDWDTSVSLFTQDFVINVLPASTNRPSLRKDEYAAALKGSINQWFTPNALKFTIQDVHETVSGDTIIAHVTSGGTSKLGTPWHNEYIFVVTEEDGKIKKIAEFMDSGFIKGFLEAEAKASSPL